MTDKNRLNGQEPGANQQNNTKRPFTDGWIASESLLTVFASLWMLCKGSSSQMDGSHLAQALQRLVSAEVAPGGPYADTSGVVDPLANAAIALFLRAKGVHLPTLAPFMAQFEPTDLEKRVRVAAIPDIEAAPRALPLNLTAGYEGLLVDINTRVRVDMAAWPDPLAALGEQMFAMLLRADKTGEIRLMPQLFAGSLAVSSDISNDQLVLLGVANVFFWIGGMLFDDFLDEEGKPELLPIATVAHRHALALYRQITAHNPRQYEHLETYCLRADHANAWEVTHARVRVTKGIITLSELPEYGDHWTLADRSIGHLFGPLLIMRQLSDATDVQLAHAEQGLRHYLIARQLNDDIHDWRKDLGVGQLSAVVVALLSGAGVRPGNHRLTTLIPTIEQHFMDRGLEFVGDLLEQHTALARESLAASGLVATAGGLNNLITRQESIMHAALETNDNYHKFLATFSDKN